MIDDYFERPYWIVDILPFQVPADSPGQYFAVEEYYLQKPRWQTLRRKYLEILLKLNCYYDMEVTADPGGDGDPVGDIDPDAWPGCGWQKNPAPETLEKLIMEGPEKNPEYFTVKNRRKPRKNPRKKHRHISRCMFCLRQKMLWLC